MRVLIKILAYFVEYARDMAHALRFNSRSPMADRDRKQFYSIVIRTHAIEKGLSLPHPRSLFGQRHIAALMELIPQYNSDFSPFPLEMARGALLDYVKTHRTNGRQEPYLDGVEAFANDATYFEGIEPLGGVRSQSVPTTVDTEPCLDFLRTRFSCRSYRPEVVPQELVEQVVSAAQWTPSQCNRQSVRVHCFQDRDHLKKLLLLQSGASGFHEHVFNLFVVSSDATAWLGAATRNQLYVDGGLFSLGLMLACHAYGLGTCALNLAVDNAKERRIKAVGSIPPCERLVLMIAFGYPSDHGVKAARSPRMSVSDVLSRH